MTRPLPIQNLQRVDLDPEIPFVLAGHIAQQERADAAHRFAQDASFLYLTGINEPNWTLIVDAGRSNLVMPPKDDVRELFDGGLSAVEATELSGVDEVLSHEAGRELLQRLAATHAKIQAFGKDPRAAHYDFTLNQGPVKLHQWVKQNFKEVVDVRPAVYRARAIKQPHEIAALRRAVEATARAFEEVKQGLAEKTHEYELEAVFAHYFRTRNMDHAYAPIIAGGARACTLHYGKNEDELPARGLVLMDVGARNEYFSADITRTYIRGEASPRERAVHDAVRRAHEAIIATIKPGVSFESYQNQSDDIMKEALAALGLLQKESDYRRYFPHAVSHGLGIDVHESLGGFDAFRPGMILTVEPGIYIPEEGIGVRLEDDILVTDRGNENLSASLSLDL